MYELIEADPGVSLNDELVETADALCKYLNFDHWKIIMLNRDNLYGFVFCSSENGAGYSSPTRKRSPFYNLTRDTYLRLTVEQGKIVFYKNKKEDADRFSPLTKGVSNELYFPLFTLSRERKVFGCLYFSKKDLLKGKIGAMTRDRSVSSHLAVIQRIMGQVFLKYIRNRRLFNLIHILSEIVGTREPLKKRHPYNVAYLSNLIGEGLGLPNDQLYSLYMAALFHDVGKLYIPLSVLKIQGPLPDTAMEEMKRHPQYSHDMVKDLTHGFDELLGIEKVILHHHENYDGSGYPGGLSGQDIPLHSRIIAVANSIDAMMTRSNYKSKQSLKEIIDELIEDGGQQFDPAIARFAARILIKKREDQSRILGRPLVLGSVELSTKEDSCQFRGVLIKTEFAYRFVVNHGECECKKCKCLLPDIVKAAFYTVDHGLIHEYDAVIFHQERRKIYFSKLTPVIPEKCFSLSWLLNGTLILKKHLAIKIAINRIGGTFLEFCIDEQEIDDLTVFDRVIRVTVHFEDGSITVAGKVNRTIRVEQKIYGHFVYLNVLEHTRDKIFERIFQRQVSFNRSLLNI